MSYLNEASTLSLIQNLVKFQKLPAEKLNSQITSYWRDSGLIPDYDFAHILRIAQLFRKSPIADLLNTDQIEIYGSLPNGKGTINSDIDTHFGPKLNKMFRVLIGSTSYDEIKHRPATLQAFTQRARELSNRLLETEKFLATELSITDFDSTEFYSINSEPTEYFYVEGFYNIYNFLSIVIGKDHTYLKVYDYLNTKESYLIEIE
jgi:hypothetical protein